MGRRLTNETIHTADIYIIAYSKKIGEGSQSALPTHIYEIRMEQNYT